MIPKSGTAGVRFEASPEAPVGTTHWRQPVKTATRFS